MERKNSVKCGKKMETEDSEQAPSAESSETG